MDGESTGGTQTMAPTSTRKNASTKTIPSEMVPVLSQVNVTVDNLRRLEGKLDGLNVAPAEK